MPGGQTYRLKTRAGWCHHCNGMRHFEQLEEDQHNVFDTLEKLRQEPEHKLKRCGFLGRWLFRGAVAQVDAYRHLEAEEQARFQLLACRTHPCCLGCGAPATSDTFDAKYWSDCAACGSPLKQIELVARFHRRRTLTYYDGQGQRTNDEYLASNTPVTEDESAKSARSDFEFALLMRTGFLGTKHCAPATD